MEYYYKGDIKKLIPNGWKFQKLYARDYKTYSKGEVIMYVVSKMCIEISNVKRKDQPTLIKFILDNLDKPQDFWEFKSNHRLFHQNPMFPNRVLQDGEIVTHHEAIVKKCLFYRAFELDEDTPYQEDGLRISNELIATIKNLTEVGEVTCS